MVYSEKTMHLHTWYSNSEQPLYKQFRNDPTISHQVILTFTGRGSTSIPKASATTRMSENKIAASTPYLRNGCMVTSLITKTWHSPDARVFRVKKNNITKLFLKNFEASAATSFGSCKSCKKFFPPQILNLYTFQLALKKDKGKERKASVSLSVPNVHNLSWAKAAKRRFALYSLYSGRCRPAWRNSQTGTSGRVWATACTFRPGDWKVHIKDPNEQSSD